MAVERTGLSQDILRVWERRYRAVEPSRGPEGKRLYSDDDIARLRLMHAATRAGGRTISAVAPLSTAGLATLVREDDEARAQRPVDAVPPPLGDAHAVIRDAVQLTLALDGARLDERLRRAASQMGILAFLESVAVPLLRVVGDEWHAGKLGMAHEHLVSSMVHDIALETMRSFARPTGAPRVLVATPAGDRHALGAALVGTIAAVEGWDVIYVGADLPASEIAAAAGTADARMVALSLVYVDDRERVLAELIGVRSLLPPDVALVIGGAGASLVRDDLKTLRIAVESSLTGWAERLRRERPTR